MNSRGESSTVEGGVQVQLNRINLLILFLEVNNRPIRADHLNCSVCRPKHIRVTVELCSSLSRFQFQLCVEWISV